MFQNGCVLQMVTEHAEVYSEGQMELPDEDEEDLCKVWDMATDKVKYCHLFSIKFSWFFHIILGI